MESSLFHQQHSVRNRPCHGCIFRFHGERPAGTGYETGENVHDCRSVRHVSDPDAADGMDLRTHGGGTLFRVSEADPLDRADSAAVSRRQNASGGRRGEDPEGTPPAIGWTGLLLQGIATSIDALSVGFTIAEYSWLAAAVEALIIGVVTFEICMVGLRLGKHFGTKLAGRASILGGIVLIGIGLEIFIKGVFWT